MLVRMPSAPWTPPDLSAAVAVVTGASRGVGRGIAEVLGECRATVYVTGRSVAGETTEGLPGTVDETAAAVSAGGGNGIAVRCDHTDDEQVAALFRRVEKEQARLDVLINNAWGGYEEYDETFAGAFWEQPIARWDRMFDGGVRTHYTASRLAVPLMLRQGKGLIVNTSYGDKNRRLANLMYDVAKTAVDRMAAYMAEELREYGIAALALYPGFTRTELVLRYYGGDPGGTHSPSYVGRAVAALAGDGEVLAKSGLAVSVDDVAREYGFDDPS
jgi:NAD(P)-dependent dehydrogenase (short-subunit alcohol dehydrogenase family)